MINAKKLANLKQILNIFDQEKNAEIRNIKRINLLLQSKLDSIARLVSYKNEYLNKSESSLMNSVPSLIKNRQDFIKKLDDAINDEKRIAELYEHEKIASIMKMEELIQKILVIDMKIGKYVEIIRHHEDEVITVELNEMSVIQCMKDKS